MQGDEDPLLHGYKLLSFDLVRTDYIQFKMLPLKLLAFIQAFHGQIW